MSSLNPPRKLLIFDLDGTLIDLKEMHRECFREAYAQIRRAPLDPFVEASLEALPTKEKLIRLGITGPDAKQIHTIKQQLTVEAVDKLTYLDVPDCVRLMLNRLHQAPGLSLMVYSNSLEHTVYNVLRNTMIFQDIDGFAGNDSAGITHPKPNPQGYIYIMKQFGVSPEHTHIFEDSPVGVEAGRASGAWTHVVSGPEQLTWDYVMEAISHG